MEDGDIDYARYTAREIHEALGGIRRDQYPKNHANLVAALVALGERAPATLAAQAQVARASGVEGAPELADRGARLGAVLLDALIGGAIVFPVEYVQGFWQTMVDAARNHEQLPFALLLPWFGFGLLVFVLVQGFPLVKDGQTWGKKLLSIRIVDRLGRKASIPQLVVRYGVDMVVGAIPFVGRLANLVNILLIFRNDRRCGHDLVAGTYVVAVVPQAAGDQATSTPSTPA